MSNVNYNKLKFFVNSIKQKNCLMSLLPKESGKKLIFMDNNVLIDSNNQTLLQHHKYIKLEEDDVKTVLLHIIF